MVRRWITSTVAAGLLVLVPAVRAQDTHPGFLGIQGESTAADANEKGARVVETVKDSPAEKAGLKAGDVIVAVGDKKVESYDDLAALVGAMRSGDKVQVKVMRDGKELALDVTLADRPKPEKAEAERSFPFEFGPEGFRFRIPGGPQEGMQRFRLPQQFYHRFESEKRPMIGIHLQPIDDELREKLALGDVEGVLVSEVVENGPAAKAGVKAEDVIVEAEGKPVADPKNLIELIRAKKAGDVVAMKVRRGDQTIDLKVSVEMMETQAPPQGYFAGPEGQGFIPIPFGPAADAEKRIAELQQKVDRLERKVDELNKLVEELHKSEDPPAKK